MVFCRTDPESSAAQRRLLPAGRHEEPRRHRAPAAPDGRPGRVQRGVLRGGPRAARQPARRAAQRLDDRHRRRCRTSAASCTSSRCRSCSPRRATSSCAWRARAAPHRHPVTRQALAELYLGVETFRHTCQRTLDKLLRMGMPGPEASIIKLHWTALTQAMPQIGMSILGAAGLLYDTPEPGERGAPGAVGAERLPAVARRQHRLRHVGDHARHHRDAGARAAARQLRPAVRVCRCPLCVERSTRTPPPWAIRRAIRTMRVNGTNSGQRAPRSGARQARRCRRSSAS